MQPKVSNKLAPKVRKQIKPKTFDFDLLYSNTSFPRFFTNLNSKTNYTTQVKFNVSSTYKPSVDFYFGQAGHVGDFLVFSGPVKDP